LRFLLPAQAFMLPLNPREDQGQTPPLPGY
jgi:hypothetical protein